MSKQRIGWWTIDYAGAKPDIGTLEHIASLIVQGYESGQIIIEDEDEVAS